jgi:putative membrane protein
MLALVLPWEFSPTVLLATTLALALYLRGAAAGTVPVPYLRRAAYFAGIGSIYLALQTACNYYSSHMLFVLQLQHFLLHDLAPALLAAAAPGAALACGLPRCARSRLQAAGRVLGTPLDLLLDARIATALYVVSQHSWLLPPIAFDVMLSNRLFKLMNWSVVLGALPFWHLMLDPRPYPLARLRLRRRFIFLYLGMLPMTLASAALAFSQTNWYPVYAVCGRFLPISPVMDQELSGTAMWVPGAVLSGLVFFLFLGRRLDQGAIAVTSGSEGKSPGRANPRRGTAAGPA